jgi:predicted helicase
LEPVDPYYFFVPKDFSLKDEYETGWRIQDIYSDSATGTGTGRDAVLVAFDREPLESLAADLVNPQIADDDITERYSLKNTSGWDFFGRREVILRTDLSADIQKYHYRPFDIRFVLYNPIIRRDSRQIMWHMRGENRGLLLSQQQAKVGFHHVFCAQHIVDESALSTTTRERGYVFPLYLYPEEDNGMLFDSVAISPWESNREHSNRVPNLTQAFVNDIEEKLSLTFDALRTVSDPGDSFGPENVLAYIYAILHSPTYRERYAEFLKIDFPRVPLTSDVDLFWTLVALGDELIRLHLMDHPALARPLTSYPVPGDNRVKRRGGFPTFIPAGESRTKTGDAAERNRVYLNLEQYVAGVPEAVWDFEVGGYQVLHKWLKDRRGRVLSYDDLAHYQRMVVALRETIRVMGEIDAAIPSWPVA